MKELHWFEFNVQVMIGLFEAARNGPVSSPSRLLQHQFSFQVRLDYLVSGVTWHNGVRFAQQATKHFHLVHGINVAPYRNIDGSSG